MKQKVSVSLEKETIDGLSKYIIDGSFRNKSHVIEFAINKFMKEKSK